MFSNIGPKEIYLMFIAIIAVLSISRWLTIKTGLIAGILAGVIEVTFLTTLFSVKLLSLSNIVILLCLGLVGMFCGSFSSRHNKQQDIISGLQNVSVIRRVEKALQHRLSMEEMITAISTRFIGVSSEKLDMEIMNSLRMIGKFVKADMSCVKIFANEKIGEEKHYEVVETSGPAKNQESYNEVDTISIPIIIEDISLGFFRFHQRSFSNPWLDEDIKLIRLIGEIYVNALADMNNEYKLKLSEERLGITLHSIGDAVIAVDNGKNINMLNKTAEELLDIHSSEVIGKPLDDIFVIRYEEDNPIETNYVILKSKTNDDKYISLIRNDLVDADGELFGEVIVFRDMTKKKLKDDEILYISFHDQLTGLYNRAFFEEEIHRLDTKRQFPIALILGDANGLKLANDIFGHLEGDKLLKKIAEILKVSTRKEDIVARWGGDEFAIILPKTEEKTVAEIRERILQACTTSDLEPIKPSLALGSATKTCEGKSLNELLKEAEDRMYRHKLFEDKSTRNSIISSFEKVLFERNYETEEHVKRMQEMATKLGRSIRLSDNELDYLRPLSFLHDIGKIGIPDKILLKSGKLSDYEWEQMKKHPEKGFIIAEATNELSNIAKLILFHHERWDGTGYPKGLKGEEIPKLSRLISIVDAYDVITHSRPYKDALSHKQAMEEIIRCSGTHFDPELVKTFVQIMDNDM